MDILDNLLIFSQRNSELIAWIKQAIAALPPSDPWVIKTEDVQKAVKESLLAMSPVTNDAIKLLAADAIQKIN